MPYKVNEFARYIKDRVDFIQKQTGKEVNYLFGEIKSNEGINDSLAIQGILAYAGVSRNNRLYLPEHLAAGHEKVLPVRINHSSVLGMESELHRLPPPFQQKLQFGQDIIVGEVKLTWHPDELTLTYEGFVNNPFFIKEIKEGRMNVSLGVLYDANAPEVCDVDCYTMIKGAEFEEVSLVYHPGFPIATLEAATEVLIAQSKSARPAVLNTYIQARTTEKQEMSKRSKEQDTGIGGIDNPADGTLTDGGGGNCPENSVWDAESRTCKSLSQSSGMTSKTVTDPEAPAKVEKDQPQTSESVRKSREQDDDCPANQHKNADGDCVAFEQDLDSHKSNSGAGDDDIDNDEDKIGETLKRTSKIGEVSPKGAFAPNADLKTERRRTTEHLAKIDRAEALQEMKKKGEYLQAKELYLKELKLEKEIKVAKESARGKFVVTHERTDKATEMSILAPAQWFTAVKNEENVMPSHIWHLNKQQIFENYANRLVRYMDEKGMEHTIPMTTEQRKGTEAITGPPVADFMRIMSEQVLVLPEGKVVTPIRQFCEVKVLPPGTKEAFFYDYGAIAFGDITEGVLIGDSTTVTRSSGGATTPRGARVQINYSDIEESPIDLVASNNRSFALESVNDESIQMLGDPSYNDDTGSSGDATNRKAQGGGTKDGRWVNGNDGSALTTASPDSGIGASDTLTFAGLLEAKTIIENEGLDPSNLIMYTSPKAVKDLIQDPALDSFTGFSRPEIITEGVVERVAGINLVKSSAIAALAGGGVATGRRSVLFIPQVAFGLVTGRDLTMEAQRRNELQTIHMTGTQKIAGFVKNVEATCRVSHA